MNTFQPRFIAYAKAKNKTPENILEIDQAEYPGGCMTGFILWIGERWQEWDRLVNHRGPHWHADHVAFDHWLQGL